MGGNPRRLTNRTEAMAGTAGAVSLSIAPNADFDVHWILLKFSAAPVTAEYITVTHKSHLGTAYDMVYFDDIKPMGYTSIRIPCITGMQKGDSILVEYTNTDGNTVTGVYSYGM